jgi:hypothetical protein
MTELTNINASSDVAKYAPLASNLPDDRDALLAAARDAVEAYHNAVVNGGDTLKAELASEPAIDRYDAIVWKMNGNTFFGSRACDDSMGLVVERHCAAAPGSSPRWGQSAEFIVTVAGVRAVVVIDDAMRDHASMQFHAIDADRPFLSHTGFRSHFFNPRPGMTVQQLAEAVMAGFLKQSRVPIDPASRELVGSSRRFDWIDSEPKPQDTYEEEAGQIAFAF